MVDLYALGLAAEYGESAKKAVKWKFAAVAYAEARWAAHLALYGCDYLSEDDASRSMLAYAGDRDPGFSHLPGYRG